MIKAEILADSSSPTGERITTYKLTFPRFILAELNTHRVFSRNSASSRAIPFKKMLEMVKNNPFIPIAWQKDHSGMQGTEYFTHEETISPTSEIKQVDVLKRHWRIARDSAVHTATVLNKEGVTKQLVNRLLEPFMWHTVLLTSTEWENFFELRCPQYEIDGNIYRSKMDAIVANQLRGTKFTDTDKPFIQGGLTDKNDLWWLQHNKGQAEIHIMALAEAMWDAKNESTPSQLESGQWHIPFGDSIDFEELGRVTSEYYRQSPNEVVDVSKWLLKIASARAARISYTTVGEEGKAPDYAKDIQLHDRLLEAGHMSPFEHCARAMTTVEYESHISGIAKDPSMNNGREEFMKLARGWCRNFRGFIQYRSLIDNQ